MPLKIEKIYIDRKHFYFPGGNIVAGGYIKVLNG